MWTFTYQVKPHTRTIQMNSENTNDKSSAWHQAMEKLRAHATECVSTYSEEEWTPAMRNMAYDLGLDGDVKDQDIEVLLETAQSQGKPSYSWWAGDKWIVTPMTWVCEGLIAEHRFHTIVAPAKVGKTTFLLDFLFCLFSKQTASFLDLPLLDKNWSLYLVGADMCHSTWDTMLQASGLLDAQGNFATAVKGVKPEEDEDGLSPAEIKKWGLIAREAKERGEEPIFVFDCYSTLIDNTPGIKADEISASYYKPLRKLKNEMSRAGATTIVIHHSSKSSRRNGVVDAAAGSSKFARIPDILIKLDWLVEQQDMKKSRDKRIVLNATGRIDPIARLIERGDDGRFRNLGELEDAQRFAFLSDAEVSLQGDYARANDFVGELAATGHACTVNILIEGMGGSWNRHKARKVLDRLLKVGVVTEHGEAPSTGGRPGKQYMHWSYTWGHNNPGLRNGESLRPDFVAGQKPDQTDFVAFAPGFRHTRDNSLPPGSRVDLKLPTGHWQEGWIVKDSSGGEHTIWRYPDLTTFKSKQRIGIEIRVSNGTDDDEEL